MDAELLKHSNALTKYALELPSPVNIEKICDAPETCIFPDDIFPDAVEYVRICVIMVDYIVSAMENNKALVEKLKGILQTLAKSSLDAMTDNAQLDVEGCNAFFSMISRMFKESGDGEGFQVCIYRDILAYVKPDNYIIQSRISHVTYNFAKQMLDLIARLE